MALWFVWLEDFSSLGFLRCGVLSVEIARMFNHSLHVTAATVL